MPCRWLALALLLPLFAPAQTLVVEGPLTLSSGALVQVDGGLALRGSGRLTGEGTLRLRARGPSGWGRADAVNDADSAVAFAGRLALAGGRQQIGGAGAWRVGRLALETADSFALGAGLRVDDSLVQAPGAVLRLSGRTLILGFAEPGAWAFAAGGVVAETHPVDGGYGVVAWQAVPGRDYAVPFAAATGPVPVGFRLPPGAPATVRWTTWATGPDNLPLPHPGAGWTDSVTDLWSAAAGGNLDALVADRFWLVDPGAAGSLLAELGWTAAEASGGLAGREGELVVQDWAEGTGWLAPGSGSNQMPARRALRAVLTGAGARALAPGATPRPVTCTGFAATSGTGRVDLAWETAAEWDNRAFRVERMLDGERRWTVLGELAGAGTSSLPRAYAFRDAPVHRAGTYRLVQRDRDGTERRICGLVRGAPLPGLSTLRVGPVPFGRTLTLAGEAFAGSGTWRLLDAAGRPMASGRWREGRAPGTVTLPPGPPGAVLLELLPERGAPRRQWLLRGPDQITE